MPELTVTSPNCAHSLVLSDEEPTMYSIKLEIEEFFDLDYSPPQSAEAHDGIPGSESPESLRSESPHSGRSLSPLSTCSKTASSEAVHDASEEHICPEQTCRRNFRRANALQRHIASIHEKTGVKCPFCEEAKRLFNRSDNFQR